MQRNPLSPLLCPSLLHFSFYCLWVSRGCTNSLTALLPLMCWSTLFPTLASVSLYPPLSHILQLTCHMFCSFLLPSGKLGSSMLKGAFLAHIPMGSCALPCLSLCRSHPFSPSLQPVSGFLHPPHWRSRTLPFPKCCGSQHPCLHPARALPPPPKSAAEIPPGAFLHTRVVTARPG